tara:strand:+ start:231 stop:776 length:546 start_codon:yes stop_codon:yes gene_type:complete
MKVSVCSNNLPYGNKGQMIFPANKGDAGHDLVAHSHPRIVGDCYIQSLFTSIKYIEYDTNITLKPSEDNYGDYELFTLVYPRSSISDFNLSLCNSVGVIDSGYRNTIKIRFNYLPQPENYVLFKEKHFLMSVDSSKIYKKGDKIAQLIFANHVHPKINYVDNMDDAKSSERGMGGFGSTGK